MRPSDTKPRKRRPARFSADAVPRPSTFGEHIAHLISQLGSPPAVAVYGSVFTATSIPAPAPWSWVILFVFFALVAPLLFLIWQVKRGDVTDIDIHFRQQRKWALLVTIAGFAATWVAMMLGNAPPILRLMVGTGLLEWTAIYLVTLRWKISIHAASISGIATFLVWGFGLSAAPALLAIPVVGWSRVKLRRHTPAQVLAGIGLGSLSFAAALIFSRQVIVPGRIAR
ncbi:MAG: hypothetical protein JXC32_00590 [Anaerolineae bacterium]|nr:hypothetical protein [Anaerolineae bacterium]